MEAAGTSLIGIELSRTSIADLRQIRIIARTRNGIVANTVIVIIEIESTSARIWIVYQTLWASNTPALRR